MRKFYFFWLMVVCTMSHAVPGSYDLISIASSNFDGRNGHKVDSLVLHCVGSRLEDLLRGFVFAPQEDAAGWGVSAHYFIPALCVKDFLQQIRGIQGLEPRISLPQGEIRFPERVPVVQFVPEDQRAWHAGPSIWRTEAQGLNRRSIGIEFHAPGYGNTDGSDWYAFTPFSQGQQEVGIALCQEIVGRYAIQPGRDV